jgi:hypothetical protein
LLGASGETGRKSRTVFVLVGNEGGAYMYRKKMARVLVALALTFIMVFGGLAGVVLAESGEGGEVPLVPAGPTDASVGEEVYG